ncbi:methyltransferase domain-containing protein [Reyranella sp.]|uniref:methyltransferase domain-containing protein n=1 Tax=Reyranella sp. TaxID=1929291 RepID=UPI003BA99D88
MTDLADILRSRAIRCVYYFHADHFEPWSLGLNEKTARGVERFGEMSRKSPYGSRISLFYCPYVPYYLTPEGEKSPGRRVDGDSVTFGSRSSEQEAMAERVIRPLMAAGGHEFHLHVHHEFWTRNESNFDNPVSRWVNANSTAALDERRLDLFFQLCKDVIARELGGPFDRWAFVHGNWALAASDPLICTIETELAMIMRHGGFGDFSFPAGRGYCDPKLQAPFTCLPIDGKRGYDEPASDPRQIEAGSNALSADRFFIWNSPIKARYSSIDYYSEANRELFKDPSAVLAQWLGNSVSLGPDLFIKTHAHSMKWEYGISEDGSPIPHCHPDVVRIFDELMRVCDRAGVEFKPVTVNQVMDLVGAFDRGADPSAARAAWYREPMAPVAADASIVPVPGRRRAKPAAPVVAHAVAGGATVQLRAEAAPPADPFAVLGREMASVLRAWLRDDVVHAQGAGDFYRDLLAGDHVLQDYERAVLDYVRAECPAEGSTIVEVGVGYGILSLLLAASGYEVIAFEGDPSRFAGLQALVKAMEGHVGRGGGKVTPVRGWFPDALDASMLRPNRRNVLVTTNIVASASAKRQDAILEAARRFDDLLIDTTRFGIRRYDPDVAESFRAKITAVSRPMRSVWRKGPNEIWHFRTFRNGEAPASQHAAEVSMDTVASSESWPAVDVGTFNEELLGLHRTWMKGQAEAQQTDELYAAKLGRNSTLEAYEKVVAAVIANRFGRDTEIVEIGCGYGALSLFLARNGFVVHGFEGDRRRSAAGAWHVKEYVARHPRLADRVALTAGFFPDAPGSDRPTGRGRRLCVATNITCSYTADHQAAIIQAMSGFDAAVIDLARFGRSRNAQEERDALRAELDRVGLEPVERLYFAAPYEYWLFSAKRAADAAQAAPVAVPARPVAVPAPKADAAAPAAAAARDRAAPAVQPRGADAVFPFSGQSGVLYSVYGDRHIDACPVCHGSNVAGLWRMPMTSLKEAISVFGGYFNQIPTLQVPATVYCFDFCRDCESIFLNPAPRMQKDQYRRSDHYLRTLKDNEAQWQGYENAYNRFAKWIPEDATTLMDAACGIGPYLHVARKRAPDRWRRLIGLELSEKYVEYMRSQGLEAHSFDIDNDDLNQFVAAESVDFITFCEAFEHVERPLDALEKLLVTLRAGGRLYFTAQRYGTDVQAAVRPGEPIYIGEKVMKELPARLGCKVVDVTTSGMRYYVVLEK